MKNNDPFVTYEGLGFEPFATDNCDTSVEVNKYIYDQDGNLLYDSKSDDPAGDFKNGPGTYKMVYEAIDDYTFGLLLETDDPAGDFSGGPGKYKMVYWAPDKL